MNRRRRVIIHCGATHVSLLEVAFRGRRHFYIKTMEFISLAYDSGSDKGWMDALFDGIHELRKKRKPLPGLTVVIPGFKVLVKNMKVPHVEKSKRRSIVAYEAQEILPCPLEGLDWDYQETSDDGVETSLVFQAVERSWMEDFSRRLEEAGLQPQRIRPEVGLDYQNYRNSCLELEEPGLIINIGGRTTLLSYVHDGGYCSRAVAFGGNRLTRMIANKLDLPPDRAEAFKVGLCEESSPGEGADAELNQVHGEVEQFIKMLNMEINRSAVTFQKHGGAPPLNFILLTGGGSKLPGLREALERKQKTGVGFVEMEATIPLGPAVDRDLWNRHSRRLTGIIGEAISSPGKDKAGINFLPKVIRKRRRSGRRRPVLLVSAFGLAILLLSLFYHANQLEAIKAGNIRVLEAEIAKEEAWSVKINEMKSELDGMREAADQLDHSLSSRGNWVRFFQELQDSFYQVGDVWLDELSVSRDETSITSTRFKKPVEERFRAKAYPSSGRVVTQLSLSGNLLLRQSAAIGQIPVGNDYDETIITERIRTMIRQFSESDFILDYTMPTIFWTRLEDGILPFSFNVTINPEHPL